MSKKPSVLVTGASRGIGRAIAMAFAARERVQLPAPGDIRPARFTVELYDLIWEALYAPIVGAVVLVADRLNRFQYLTIRQYLSLVFLALLSLLSVLAIWS